MKKTLLLFVSTILLISCKFTERVYIRENGSVEYESELNFSDMMGLMFTNLDKDSLRQIGEYPLDTLMRFSDMESMSGKLGDEETSDAEREFMKALDKFTVRMLMNDDEGKMVFGLKEKDVNSFNTYMKHVQTASDKLAKKDKKSAENLSNSGIMNIMEFSYNGKTFTRRSNGPGMGFDEIEDSTAQAAREMMGMFDYKLEYHFPKKVKKSSIKNATFSLDGKTMTIETTMMELMENPDKYNFTVEFE